MAGYRYLSKSWLIRTTITKLMGKSGMARMQREHSVKDWAPLYSDEVVDCVT